MNDLPDDPQLRHIELNKINVLTHKSLDLASELCHCGNREWYDGNDNINTINDKIDLVNEIGEVINSFMTEAYNIIDAINKSHNNESFYDTLAEDMKKCKDTILKMINSFNICIKQDTNKNDTDNVNVCEKQDTQKNDTLIMSMYVRNWILIKMKQVLMKEMMMILIVRLMMMIVRLMMMMIVRLMMMMIELIRIFLI